MMVVIGIGKPKGPMKKAEGGPLVTGLAEDEGRYTEATRNARAQRQLKDFRDKAAEARWAASQARGSDWADKKSRADIADEQEAFARRYAEKISSETGYKKGGKVAKVMGEFGEGKLHSGSKKGPKVTNPKQAIAIALNEAGKSKKARGGKVNSVPVKDIKSGKVPQSTDEDFYGKAEDMPMPPRRPAGMKKGGMKHDDAAQDKAMIKSMIKPSALKKAGGGMAQKVQMAKSNAIEASMNGQKKTGYADGGDIGLAAPRMTSPLQAMAARTRSVPVAPRNPMIPLQAAAPGGSRIGVGRARAGKPDVGAIRAAMARAATQAMPESAPSMMKKGGKVKC
jgi:hypothetical protein